MAKSNKGAAEERAADAYADWFYTLTNLGFRPFALDVDGKPPVGWRNLAKDAYWQDQEEFDCKRGEIYEIWLEDCPPLAVLTGSLGGVIALAAYGEEGRRSVRELGISTPVMARVADITYYYLRHPVGQWIESISRLLPGVDLLGEGCWAPAPMLLPAEIDELPEGIPETIRGVPIALLGRRDAHAIENFKPTGLHSLVECWIEACVPDDGDDLGRLLWQLRHASVSRRGRMLCWTARAIAELVMANVGCPPEFRTTDRDKAVAGFIGIAEEIGIARSAAERLIFKQLRLYGTATPDHDHCPRDRFKPIPAGEFAKGASPDWLVKGVLPRAALAVIYGASGSGKTFFVLDLVASVALGRPWRELKVKQANVLYIAAEGAGGLRARLMAYQQAHDVEFGSAFQVIAAQPNFLTAADPTEIILETKRISAGLVVVDTLAQATPGGDENSAVDMGRALKQCRRLHEETGATVILIHHAGKDASRGARGWSGIRAACDAEIEVALVSGSRIAKVTKQKDGAEGAEFGFILARVFLGLDADGDEIESCVVREREGPAPLKVSIESVVDALRREPKREDQQSPEWAGYVIAAELGVDVGPNDAPPDVRQAEWRRAICVAIKQAVSEGLVVRQQLQDQRRRMKWFVRAAAQPAQPLLHRKGESSEFSSTPTPPV